MCVGKDHLLRVGPQTIARRYMYPGGYAGDTGAWALVTIDEQADGWHVCFIHHWGSHGLSVTNAIEKLATAV
jgi:hypothetical protein